MSNPKQILLSGLVLGMRSGHLWQNAVSVQHPVACATSASNANSETRPTARALLLRPCFRDCFPTKEVAMHGTFHMLVQPLALFLHLGWWDGQRASRLMGVDH